VPERAERGLVERHAARQILHLQSDVIEHVSLLKMLRRRC
jgi:hypothetical protein